MSDLFAEAIEEVAADEQPETEVEQEQPAEPELTDEQLAAALEKRGIDYKKAQNLTEYERTVNAKSSDLGRIAKELEAARAAIPKPADEPTLDAETQAELKAALKAIGLDVDALTGSLELAKTTVSEAREEAFGTFVESHPDVEPTEIMAELIEGGIDPNALTPAALKRELNKAYKVVKAAKLDPDAIAKAAVDKYIADLQAKGVKPEEVVEVRKGRGSATGAHRSVDDLIADPNTSIFDKMAVMQDAPE